MFRLKKFATISLTLILILFLKPEAATADPVEHFINIIPEETENFVLENIEFDEDDFFLSARYTHKPTGMGLGFYMEYDSQEKIREVASSFIGTHKITYALDRQEFFDAMDRQERREIDFNEVRNRAGMFKWQYNHSTLKEDHPELELLPVEVNDFGMTNFNSDNPMSMTGRYQNLENSTSINTTIRHGVTAEMRHNLYSCNMDNHDAIELGVVTFYTEHQEIRGDYQATARAYFDDVQLEVVYEYENQYGDTPDTKQANETIEAYLNQFDLQLYRDFEFGRIEGPGHNLEPIAPDAEEFADMIPEPEAPLVIRDVISYDDAMHLRVDYYHEPDDFEFSIHYGYRDYNDRIDTGLGTTISRPFMAGVEVCILEDGSHFDYVRMTEAPSEKDIVHWEFNHMDLTPMNPLVEFFSTEIGNYSLVSYSSDTDDLRFTGEYEHQETGQTTALSARYGTSAGEQYNRYHLLGFEEEKQPFEVDGMTFHAIEMRGDVVAYSYFDDLMIEVGLEDVDDPEDIAGFTGQLSGILQDFGTDQFSSWQVPEDFREETNFTLQDGTPLCLDPYCMDEKLAACESGAFGGQLQWNLGVVYMIEEPADNNQCRLSMQYTRNPNDEIVEQPLYFYIDRDEKFSDVARDRVTDCMETSGGDNCHGPLLEYLEE